MSRFTKIDKADFIAIKSKGKVAMINLFTKFKDFLAVRNFITRIV